MSTKLEAKVTRAIFDASRMITLHDANVLALAAIAAIREELGDPVAWRTRGMTALRDEWMPWVMIDALRADIWRNDPSYRNGRREIEPLYDSPLGDTKP